MNSYGLKRVRDAAEAAETDGRAIKRYSQALACAIAALEAAEARIAELEAHIADIATVAGRDVSDAIDNDGQPYQSQALDAIIRAALPAAPTSQQGKSSLSGKEEGK